MRHVERMVSELTAGEAMSRDVVVVPLGMSVVAAARLLREQQVPVAAVTDAAGRCVGALTANDFVRWVADGGRNGDALASRVWCDWQVVDEASVRRDEVRRHMTRDALLVTANKPLADVAEALDGSRHRPVVVVNEKRRPLGVVSRELLGALAFDKRRPKEALPAAASWGNRVQPQRLPQPAGPA